jgi:uncharacterized protein with ATP-grasp and redox domains
MIIEVLKAGQLYVRLLDGFEAAFINEIAPRYAKYGRSMMVVGQQLKQFKKLAVKLNIIDFSVDPLGGVDALNEDD